MADVACAPLAAFGELVIDHLQRRLDVVGDRGERVKPLLNTLMAFASANMNCCRRPTSAGMVGFGFRLAFRIWLCPKVRVTSTMRTSSG